jgi:hypothetical protein
MPVTQEFNGSGLGQPPMPFGWTKFNWTASTGQSTTTGWAPYLAHPSVSGSYRSTSYSDAGAGGAVAATIAVMPASEGQHFSLWTVPNPLFGRHGYELKATRNSAGKYSITLSRWTSGTPSVLAVATEYVLSAGSSLALVDQGGSVSAWVDSGSGFFQVLSASDSAFSSGYVGLSGSGTAIRLTKWRAGNL